MIPGAEYAPVVAINLFRQPHISTPDDEAMVAFAQHERYAPGEPLLWRVGFDRVLHIVPHPTTVRRLTVTDPDDQRVIWRLAALQLGASESQAEVAVMLRAERDWWVLRPATYQSKAFYLARVHAPDLAHATAALCAAVWGPA